LAGILAVIFVVFYRRLGMNVTRHRAIMLRRDVIHKSGSTYRIATPPPKEDRATAIGNMRKNLVSSAVWFSSYASGQTDTQTYLSQYFALLPGAK